MPAKRSNPKTMYQAGELRKELTPAERKLWAYLRGNKLNECNFRRQHALGNYIVDFVSIKRKLVIELDGSQHLEQVEYDIERTKYLESWSMELITQSLRIIPKNAALVRIFIRTIKCINDCIHCNKIKCIFTQKYYYATNWHY